jgi:aerobic carbon-monoxide dehydrogenase small subunit
VQPVAETKTDVEMMVNGRVHSLALGRDFTTTDTLADVLRDCLGLVGLKVACDQGACGACTVIMDGRAVLSCMVLAVEAGGHDILTVEGLSDDDPVLQAFACQCEPGSGTAMQCGFCTPGAVMTAKALLMNDPDPSLEDVRQALAGNLCRCGCYAGITAAVLNAATLMRPPSMADLAVGKESK